MKFAFSFLVLSLAFCISGCNSSMGDGAAVGNLGSKSLDEVLAVAVEQTEELRFCLEEGAEGELIANPVKRLKEIASALPDFVADSGLPENREIQLKTTAEKVISACNRLTESGGAKDQMKVCNELKKQINKLQQMSK